MKGKNGSLFVLAAALLFSIGGVCAKYTAWRGLTVNGFRCLIGLVHRYISFCYKASARFQ